MRLSDWALIASSVRPPPRGRGRWGLRPYTLGWAVFASVPHRAVALPVA